MIYAQYKSFSRKLHKKYWFKKLPSVCQFELTHNCGLACRYCSTRCYNTPRLLKRELETPEVKSIIDKIADFGVLWICFTGGDPLARSDFAQVYRYTRAKGFIISVFTSGASITPEVTRLFRDSPPFVVELTLNSSDERTCDKITGVRGSFRRICSGINTLKKAGINLRLKAILTRENSRDVVPLKKFAEDAGVELRITPVIYPRFNGDNRPVRLRLEPDEVLRVMGVSAPAAERVRRKSPGYDKTLFNCSILGGDGFHVDPRGNMLLCPLMRPLAVDLVRNDISKSFFLLLERFKSMEFKSDSPCRGCALRYQCGSCPGRAVLETGDPEKPVAFFCELTKKMSPTLTGTAPFGC
ncbi:MAG: radical SAM protein [Candidatus Omnitrophica bacterium]|nr:radical SAM protein [Candidatus Omnitrophota bacterium]